MIFLALNGISKKLFIIIFGVIFFIFGFWVLQPVAKVSAVTCIASCNTGNLLGVPCGNRCWYTGPHADPGPTPQGACSVGTALGQCDPLVIFDTNCTSAEMSCKEQNCGGLSKPTGTACKISLASWNGIACGMTTKDGNWNDTKKECSECSGPNAQGYAWGNATTIFFTTQPLVFKRVCGADTACEDKASTNPATVGSACESMSNTAVAGDTCNVSGKCFAPPANQVFLSIVASKNPVVVNGTSTLTFTTKKADGTAVNNATITNQTIGCGTLASNTCATGAAGNTCTIVYTAPAAASTCELTFTASAAGYTTGSAAFTFNIVSATFKIVECDALCTAFGPNTCSSKIGTTLAGCGGNPPCIDADGVVKTIIKNDSDCQVGTDNNNDGTPEGYCSKSDIDCSDGTYYNECSSTKPTYCAISNCATGALSLVNKCGTCGCPNATDVCNADGSCSVAVVCNNNGIQDNGETGVDCGGGGCPACAGPGCNNNGIQDNGETGIDCGGGGCPACAGPGCNNNGIQDNGETGIDCGGGGCPACAAVPPAASCSGPGMFVSPLGPGYCTIGEILTNATNWILALVSSVIVLILIIGGLMYISSSGDEEKLRTSKNIIYYAVVGLGIILISYALITEVTNLLKGP